MFHSPRDGKASGSPPRYQEPPLEDSRSELGPLGARVFCYPPVQRPRMDANGTLSRPETPRLPGVNGGVQAAARSRARALRMSPWAATSCVGHRPVAHDVQNAIGL